MSDLFGKLGAAAKQTAEAAGLQVAIAAEQQKIRSAYQILGKLYYQDRKRGRACQGPEYDRQTAQIDASCRKIRELKFRKTVDPAADADDFEVID